MMSADLIYLCVCVWMYSMRRRVVLMFLQSVHVRHHETPLWSMRKKTTNILSFIFILMAFLFCRTARLEETNNSFLSRLTRNVKTTHTFKHSQTHTYINSNSLMPKHTHMTLQFMWLCSKNFSLFSRWHLRQKHDPSFIKKNRP